MSLTLLIAGGIATSKTTEAKIRSTVNEEVGNYAVVEESMAKTVAWLQDNEETDFSMYGANVGFVGLGQIGRELVRLLSPFRPVIRAYDPWLPASVADQHNVGICSLEDLFSWARCIFVTAVPSTENRGLVSADLLSRMQDNGLLVLLSRAHLVDFDALVAEAASGRLRVATDVFPSEPVDPDHPARSVTQMILSPHRAAAVKGGRRLIGDMILADLDAIMAQRPERLLGRADPARMVLVSGVGDAAQVADMAAERR